jgi:alpha-beta hydrolase superfamily lysophospholipase
MVDITHKNFLEHGPSSGLIVFLHGWTRTAADMRHLATVALKERPGADHYLPDLPIANPFCRVRAGDLAASILSSVDELIARRANRGGQGYDTIIFVGHSCGAVLARAMWALAIGGTSDGTIDIERARQWTARVERIVLLAAVLRGWSSDAPVSPGFRLAGWVGDLVEPLIGSRFLVYDLRRGSSFLTTARLQSLDAQAKLSKANLVTPLIVQLLGTKDDVVAPADNVDLASGGNFVYLEMPDSGHLDVVALGNSYAGKARRNVFRMAFADDREKLAAEAFSPQEVADLVDDTRDDHDQYEPALTTETKATNAGGLLPPTLSVRDDVRTVIFLVHGIRDYGFWTKKLAVRIKRRARVWNIPCRTVTSSYGFFPMGPFLLKSKRRKYVGWLMDQYVTAKALYPQADFCFVGHSNGTYLLARALLDCPAIRFRRIVFAGSVVRANYEWNALLKCGRVDEVVNYVATNDWVVASVPRALQYLGFPDLGDAGMVASKSFLASPK